MKPKISIIIPCYNVEKYIERCIKSLVDQSIGLENLELIFVNDASTDSTLSMLLEFEKQYSNNILVINLPENCKQGGARNIGIDHASADYIGFVDSDDWIELTMYEKLYSKMQQYNCDAVVCRSFSDYPDGKSIGNAKGEDSFITSTTAIKDKEQSWYSVGGVGVWNTIYRKSLIIDNQIFFPERLTYEDNYWTAILRLYIKSVYILEENLYHYCINLGSTIHSVNSLHHLDRLKIELLKLDAYKEIGVFDTYHNEIEVEFLNMFYVNTLHILFTRFDPIPINIIFYMTKCVFDVFPNYKNNPYFAQNPSSYHEFLSLLEMNLDEEEWYTVAQEYRNIYIERYS